MASSSKAKSSKKKGGGTASFKFLRNLIERPKSASASAVPSNASRVSLSSGSGGQDPVPGNKTGTVEITAPGGNATSHQESGSQTQGSDRKATVKDGLGVASRFGQTLLKRVAECVDTNPVKVAFSIAKVIIEMKDAVGDNKDELVQRLEDTADRLLAVERAVAIGVPKAAEREMEKLTQILREEMSKLQDLARKSLAIQVLDHEEYQKMIRHIFQRVNGATASFQLEMANSIQETANAIRDDTKKAALRSLRPSEKADHRTVLDQQALKREECTPNTRVEILEDISKWANDPSSDSARVFWLTGQAGSGKTTIAYTIAKQFDNGGNADQHTVLGGSFFCSRQFKETREQTRILPTLAYHLARKCNLYGDALHVADKFDAVNYDIPTQLRDLLLAPWQQSAATRGPERPPYLIVIDALDEIEGGGGSTFLRDLLNAIDEYDVRGLKFLVTSRSDPGLAKLCEAFTSEAVCRLQDVPIQEAKSDIETYLEAKLPMLSGSPGLAELVRRAGGLFIYAATAVRYLTLPGSLTVKEQVEMLDDLISKSYEPASASDATSLIDELYRQIMCDAFSKLKGKFLARRLRILFTFLCTAERTSTSVVAALLLDDDDEAAGAVLRSLHPVLYTQGNQVFWYHASFPDFIFDQTRSNFRIREEKYEFWCSEPDHHRLLSESCFHIMKSGLRFNMGDIKSSFLFDRDNTDALSEQVSKNIQAVLRYSSRHWVYHLPSPELIDTNNLRDCISEFLQIRVLFWIEAMNLLGLRNQCTLLLQRARQWVLKCGNSYLELARDVGEAANFATHFTGSPAAESTPHLYISALATWSRDSSLCRNWKKQFSRIPVFTHTKGSVDLPLMTVMAGSPVTSVAFSNDGTLIVSGSVNKSVQLWDASTGAEMKALKGHTALINSVAFSSDGTQIVSGSYDQSVRVWDLSTGAEAKVLKGHTDTVRSVAFSGDGTQIVSGSGDKSVRVWDVSTGAGLKVLKGHTYSVSSVAFSNDGTRIVSGSDDWSVRVWDALTGAEVNILEGHTSEVSSVAFSSDGTQILSGSYDLSVRVWDASTGAKVKVLKGHTSLVSSVTFSRDGTQLVSGSYDLSVRVWDASTGAEVKVLKGHTSEVSSVAFSKDGTQIVSGSEDNSVRVWDVSTAAKVKVLGGHTSLVNSVAFSRDGTQIVSGSRDRSVRVWDASTGAEMKVLKGHTGSVYSVACSSDGKQIVSGSYDRSVRVWDASIGAEMKVLKGHTSLVSSVAFSRDSTQIVSGSYDQSVRVWDASTGAEVKLLKGHTNGVNSVAFSSDGTRIVSGSKDRSVRVWDALTGAEVKVLNGHTDLVRSVAFSSDGTQIVSGSNDQPVCVWDASTGAVVKLLKRGLGVVASVAFSSDGMQIVSGLSASVRVWDVSTGAEMMVLKGHTGWVNSVAFSSDGRRIVSGSVDESVRVWDVSTGMELNELKGQADSVNSAASSNDGTQIVSGSDNQSVPARVNGLVHSVWNLASTNWIISSQGKEHLMWVPSAAQVTEPSNVLVISRHGFGSVDFQGSMIGAHWVGCYTPFFKA